MHVQLGQNAPFLLRAAAGAALLAHIGGGAVGIGAGVTALIARKGGRLHRWAGRVFFPAMLAMSGAAAVTAPLLPDRISACMGLFVFYLVLTAWLAIRRRPGEAGRLETAAAALGALAGAGFLVMGALASRHPDFVIDKEPGGVAFVVVPIVAMAVGFDLKLIQAGGIAGPARIARHLWRMCLALLIAEGSALAQPKVLQLIPGRLMPWLLAGVAACFAAMIWHLVRTRWPRRRRRSPSLPAAA